MQKAIFVNTDYEAALQTPMGHDELALQVRHPGHIT